MKAIKWLGALTVLGASMISTAPASALNCWTPSLIQPINLVRGESGLYLNCTGTPNLRAEASGFRGSGTNRKLLGVTVHNGDGARAQAYDNNRNPLNCMVEKLGIGGKWVTCSTDITFIALEAWDN